MRRRKRAEGRKVLHGLQLASRESYGDWLATSPATSPPAGFLPGS